MEAENYSVEKDGFVKNESFSDYVLEISNEFERDSRRYIRVFSEEREVV
ncbi:MAG: hypothetical protein IJ015_01505 [Ruminococcus sp.]|nr:hypothetical protein [Ruminococcus sp.]